MRILFAAPDRDLLACYQMLLADAAEEVVTAFDGTQVLTLLQKSHFDIAVLDRALPRVENRRLMRSLRTHGIPVILLLEQAVDTRLLRAEPLPGAYLSYPFSSEALIALIRDVAEKAGSGQKLRLADVEADVAAFCVGSEPVTAPELDVLAALAGGDAVARGPVELYIGALNEKLARLSSRARIRYRAGEGYQMVEQNG